jgi:hypothetical protein
MEATNLTGMPAIYKTVSDEQDDPAPKYFYGKWHGEFLDFFTIACNIVGVKDREGLPISANAAVNQFIKLKNRNLTRKASSTLERH